MRTLALCTAFVALALSSPASAQSSQLKGTWTLRIVTQDDAGIEFGLRGLQDGIQIQASYDCVYQGESTLVCASAVQARTEDGQTYRSSIGDGNRLWVDLDTGNSAYPCASTEDSMGYWALVYAMEAATRSIVHGDPVVGEIDTTCEAQVWGDPH